jgi:prepilin signal peptidase PulO-like enzyme (type II secretory pathway)
MENIFGIILAATFGAIFGSYATLFSYRLPLGESCFGRYFGPKSRCPKCDSIIKTRDLIPLFNWLFTFGRCRNCKVKIPRTHLFVELATTSLFILSYLQFSFSEEFIIYALISVSLVILFTCDFTHQMFPPQILIFILMLGLANRVLQDHTTINIIFSVAIAAIFVSTFYQIFYKKTNVIFSTQSQIFDYQKFILVAAVCLKTELFFLYFFAILAIFAMIALAKIPARKERAGYGYVLILPFLWLLFFPPIF